MNSSELFMDNKKSITNLYNHIFGYLKTIAEEKKIELTAKAPSIAAKAPGASVTSLALLRFMAGKNSSLFALGYSNADFIRIWKELFSPPAPDAGAAPKKAEVELMKSFYQFLNLELKAQGVAIDSKTAIILEGGNMGGWSQIAAEQCIVMPIGTPQGDLMFELPLFDLQYSSTMTETLYGFKENARIMVVDDSMVSRKTSRNYLAMAGYFNVDETPDGQQAFAKVFGSRPAYELVVADWHMPLMSGFELLKKLRAVEDFKKLPIILVTGEKNKEEVVSAIKEGVSSYLVKPVAVEDFFKSLKKASGKP
jgi:two-component system chemotaxis response regulator CheY